MPTDTPLEQRLRTLYEVSVPTELDRRIETAMTAVPVHRPGRTRPRVFAALAVAAILAAGAAGPALEWFGGRDDPFEGLWDVSSPVDQTVTADGYRVTVHRAHADRLGVRLAMSVQDLDERWSGLEVESAVMTDGEGREYEGWNWSGSQTPVDGSIARWARFLLPEDGPDPGDRLRATVTSLLVRTPEPLSLNLEPEQIWSSVGGAWTVEFDMPPIVEGLTISPVASATKGDVTISVDELGLVPSGTVMRLAVDGLPEIPAGCVDANAWRPVSHIDLDGETLDEWELPPGVVGSEGHVTIETLPILDDLAGHWTISVLSFTTACEPFGEDLGPWVLEFDVPETP